MNTVVVIIFIAWAIASVFAQLPSWEPSILPKLITWLPKWHFFAPEPLSSDFHFLYRTTSDSQWQELEFLYDRPKAYFIFNSNKRTKKVIIDIVSQIVSADTQQNESLIKLSKGYLSLLEYAGNAAKAENASRVQFLVMRSSKMRSKDVWEPVLVSEFHRL